MSSAGSNELYTQGIDVTDIAEDNDKINELYKNEAKRDGKVGGWTAIKNPPIISSSEYTTALLIKSPSRKWALRIYEGNEYVRSVMPKNDKGVTMVFVQPGHDAVPIEVTQFKRIT
jgi:hypothetical protein